jgi:hypothetical protein
MLPGREFTMTLKTVTKCKICQKNKFTVPYFRAPFQETDIQFHPLDKLYLDIVGPMPITEECQIYTCQDNLSKYLVAIPMFSQTAEEVALNFVLCHITIWNTQFNRDLSGYPIYGRPVHKVM